MSKLRIAIIGAGPCGLSQLLAFKKAQQQQRVELVCFERQSDWGGLWHYTSQIGIDAHGEPIHSSMYRHLWSNNPKELIEYEDYTFYDHFGCFLPSFLPRAFIYDYLNGRAKAGDIRQFIRFNTAVRHVDFDDQKNEFNIDIEDFNTGCRESIKFDRVIVATGHYHVPNMINIDGVDQFPGRVLHSHEFRGADEFVGLNLLLIGRSFSANDIALQCYKFGARSVIISGREEPLDLKWPTEIKDASMLVRMEGRKAHFKDGSSVDNIDAIIFCTGYRHSYPFMTQRFRLHSGITEFVPPNLYKSIFWVDQPYVAYLGSPRQFYTFPMFEIQAAFVRDTFLGDIKLPDKDQRQADVDKWQAKEKAIGSGDFFGMIDLQTDYLHDLLALLRTNDGNESLSKLNFDKTKQIFKEFLGCMLADIVHYRNISYESLVDTKNKKTVQVSTPWFKNMDDSMERLLNDYRK